MFTLSGLPTRDALAQTSRSAGVQYGIHYPIPIYLQKPYRDSRYRQGDFPVAERVAHEVLSLPMYPELLRAQMEEVSAAVRQHSVQPQESRST